MSLTITELSIRQNERILINCFSDFFKPKEICALTGNNGSGKTTLLKTLAGLIKPHGSINIENREINTLTWAQKARLLSFLPQNASEHPYLSVTSRIAHGLMPIFGYDFFINQEQRDLIEKMAERLNISHLLKKSLGQISTGELRLVNLAKCLINPEAKYLLLDEPSVFLDFSQQDNLLLCLKEEALMGKTIFFSSHDQYFIKELAHRVLKIENQLIKTHL